MKTLILGGVKSGKSRLAEKLALESGLAVSYIATAKPGDEEMKSRIKAHKIRRPSQWTVIEEPVALARVLEEQAEANRCVIVDCLTLWLTNLLVASDDSLLVKECEALVSTLAEMPGEIIFVSNETNMGIMPLGELTRRYCDEAGQLHQQLAGICDRVVITVAGLPQVLKEGPC